MRICTFCGQPETKVQLFVFDAENDEYECIDCFDERIVEFEFPQCDYCKDLGGDYLNDRATPCPKCCLW